MPRLISALLCLLTVHTISAQDFKAGAVTVVTSTTDPNEQYSVYVPKDYSSKKKWPILYTFSPSGGDGGMHRYQTGAAELGWIVVSSHNSKNMRDNRKTQKIIWDETHDLLSIDDDRLYSSGMSGGAREALYFSLTNEKEFAGLISCGAFRNPNAPLPKKADTYYIMVAGATDYNYAELIDYNNILKKRNIKSELVTFHGGHLWADKKLLAHCMRLHELHYQANQRKPDEKRCAELIKTITKTLKQRSADELFWHESYASALSISQEKKLKKIVGPLAALLTSLEEDERFDKEVKANAAFAKIPATKNDTAPEMTRSAKAYMKLHSEHPDTAAAKKSLSVTKSMLARAKKAKKYFGGKKGDVYNSTINEIEQLLANK